MRKRSKFSLFGAALCAAFAVAPLASARVPPLGPITAGGAASDDFQLGLSVLRPDVNIGAIIERDRMYMAERPGFITKRLPLTYDQLGTPYSGGRYLFETYDDAVQFGHWLANDFVLDGVPILQRSYFIGLTAYSYEMIGGWRWQPVESQVAMRVERWSTSSTSMSPHQIRAFLHSQLPRIEAEAEARGYSEVWLAYSEPDGLVAITYFTDRVDPGWDRTSPDAASFDKLADADSLATRSMDALQWPKVFDRVSWAFTTWFHFCPGDSGRAALWPNSPPFPQPSTTDGVCEPSRGENHLTAPADCLPTCGNAVADPGETTANCPSDVRLEPFLDPYPFCSRDEGGVGRPPAWPFDLP